MRLALPLQELRDRLSPVTLSVFQSPRCRGNPQSLISPKDSLIIEVVINSQVEWELNFDPDTLHSFSGGGSQLLLTQQNPFFGMEGADGMEVAKP